MKALSRLAVITLSVGAAMVTILVSILVSIPASIGTAWAGLGQPSPWEMDLQDSASPVMQDVAGFHFFLLWVIAAISVFVLNVLPAAFPRPCRHAAPLCGLPGRVRRMEFRLVDRLVHFRFRRAGLPLRHDIGLRSQRARGRQSVGSRRDHLGMDAAVAAAVPSI